MKIQMNVHNASYFFPLSFLNCVLELFEPFNMIVTAGDYDKTRLERESEEMTCSQGPHVRI